MVFGFRPESRSPSTGFPNYHLFKNAGSSIDFILERNFGKGFAYVHGKHHDSTVTNTDLLAFLRMNPGIRALSSHHLRIPKPEDEHFVFFEVIFLRHPLDRLRSMYDFYRRAQADDDPLVQEAHRLEIRAFIERLLTSHPHVINDAQVNFLANGGRYTRPPDAEDLQKAEGVIIRSAFPGLVETFDLSLKAVKYYACPVFGSLDVEPTELNVSPDRGKTLEARLRSMEEACGLDIFNALVETNKLDLQLWQRTEAEIRRRCNSIPNVQSLSVEPQNVNSGKAPLC
jgi:hypothetical protein